MGKYTKWDKVEIEWTDSHMIHGWVTLDDVGLDEEASLYHRSIGYFLGETPNQVTICQSSKTDEDLIKEPITNVCGVFTIPKKAIIKLSKVRFLNEQEGK